MATPAALEILPGQIAGRLSFAELFGNDRPVEIEVGIGKGRFLLEQAAARPEVNFLGLEWSLKHLRVAKERAERRGLLNLRLYRADARHVLADLIPDASVERLHIYCPDPWPKKRHAKRRFFGPATVPHLERILRPGGALLLSTDVPEYFEQIRETLSAGCGLAEGDDPLFPLKGAAAKTNYEVKYSREGRAIYRACYRRPATPVPGARRPSISRSPG